MARLLLLLAPTTYRTQACVDAATRLGVDLICASERPSTLEERAPDNLLTLDFAEPVRAAEAVARLAGRRPIDAVVAVDDLTTVVAAAIGARLGLRSNPVAAASAARNKHEMRQRLHAAGVPAPRFRRMALSEDPARAAREVDYPCVLKPLALSASRGVIRADDPDAFVAAVRRITAILGRDDVGVNGDLAAALLVEEFVPGREVALEGLLTAGGLQTLALFDKPDPLDGPFFEETIYVTPSRLPAGAQARIAEVTLRACAALGLTEGPIHAELRVNDAGPWVIEVAARTRASRSRSPDSASGPARPVGGGDVRVDDGAVALGDPINARRQLDQPARRAVEAEHLRHVLARLRIRRDAAVRRHRPLAGVVGRYPEAQIVPEALDEGAQVADARVDVLARVEGVPDAEHRGRLRHQLHEPPRALSGHRSRVESRLRPDDRPDETLRHGVSRRRVGDLTGIGAVVGQPVCLRASGGRCRDRDRDAEEDGLSRVPRHGRTTGQI